MKSLRKCLCLIALLAWAGSAFAELQNISVGGQVRIRGRYWNHSYSGPNKTNPYSPTRVGGRAVGPDGIGSVYTWDDTRTAYVEERTVLGVRAEFTDNVSAYVEIDSFETWGDDFRSADYLRGVDTRAQTVDDIELVQSYIDIKEIGGSPVSARIGRQGIKLGKGFLLGESPSPTSFIPFDGIRLTYKEDALTIDGFWFKLADNMTDFGKGDIDFYGVYATYKLCEALELSGYYFYVRDDRAVVDNADATVMERVWEHIWDLDDYGTTNLHTVGLRANGKAASFDYDLELSYQFGQADALGSMLKLRGYGDPDAEFGGWAGDVEVGYSFDANWSPRVFVGATYYSGGDNRKRSFLDYLNPFYRPEASVSFNRLFSTMPYMSTWDARGGSATFTNYYAVRTGGLLKFTPVLSSGLLASYYWVAQPWDEPVSALSSLVPWWTQEADRNMGLATSLWFQYDYSKDLSIKLTWEHFFSESGMTDGNFLMHYGTMFTGGTADSDTDYVCLDMLVKF